MYVLRVSGENTEAVELARIGLYPSEDYGTTRDHQNQVLDRAIEKMEKAS